MFKLRRWKNFTVPYIIDQQMDGQHRNKVAPRPFMTAQLYTCIKVVHIHDNLTLRINDTRNFGMLDLGLIS